MELFSYPIWAEVAFREFLLGVREAPGPEANLRILEYFQATSLEPPDGDETPWCAAAINWCLRQCAIRGTGLANARSFQRWGMSVPKQRGAIAVLWRVSRDDWRGHVGILVGDSLGWIEILGANQGNGWSIRRYPSERLLSCRWPTTAMTYAV